MSTVPPEQPPPSQPTPPPHEQPTQQASAYTPPSQHGRTQLGLNDIARLPMPGNAEFVLYLLLVTAFTLIWWFDDDVASGQWMTIVTALTFGYFISRGIAKASRVLEQ